MINTIITDIITESEGKSYIKMSDEVFTAISKLKDFNYEHIYGKAYTVKERELINKMFRTVFDGYLNDLKTKIMIAQYFILI